MPSIRATPFLLLAVLVLAIARAAASGTGRDRIYNPSRAPIALEGLAPNARRLAVTTSDGLALNGILVPPGDRSLLLVFHGSGASATDVARWLKPVSDHGYGLIVAEYRGFSGNPGTPSEAGLLKDAQAFYRAARSAYPTSRLIVVGHSLGGGVAFDLALAEPVNVLVTIGTFPNLKAMVSPLERAFLPDKFDNVAALSKLRPETFYYLLHGSNDEIVPAGMANQLHNQGVRSGRAGASFILHGQPHRPDAVLIGSVLDYISAIVTDGSASLPTGASIAPFSTQIRR